MRGDHGQRFLASRVFCDLRGVEYEEYFLECLGLPGTVIRGEREYADHSKQIGSLSTNLYV